MTICDGQAHSGPADTSIFRFGDGLVFDSNIAEDQRFGKLVLVCGPWGSGTSTLCGMLVRAGLPAPGPYTKINDPRTPDTYGMLAFQQLLKTLASEPLFKRLQPSDVIVEKLVEFRETALREALMDLDTGPFMLKHPLAILFLPELNQAFDLRMVCVIRSFADIEATRVRRNWHKLFGRAGAGVLYSRLFEYLIDSHTPFKMVRHTDLLCEPQKVLDELIEFCNLTTGDSARKAALDYIAGVTARQGLAQIPPTSWAASKNKNGKPLQITILKNSPFAGENVTTLFAVLKNERYFLPHFLQYYRALGISNFLFLDDQSTDGSREYLLAQKDCGILEANYSFGDMIGGKRFGIAVKQIVPETMLMGGWVLTVDLDEFLILPPPYENIHGLCIDLDKQGRNHARAIMLDFYPERFNDLNGTVSGMGPFELCPYFDALSMEWPDGSRAPTRISIQDAIRVRMFKEMITRGFNELTALRGYKCANPYKVPLLKWDRYTRVLSSHHVNVPVSDANQLVLAHFKFYPGWQQKVEAAVAGGAYYNNSIEYKMLKIAADRLLHWPLKGKKSKTFEGRGQLNAMGLVYAAGSGG